MVGSPPPESIEDHTLDNGVARITPFTQSIVGDCSEAGPAPAGFGLTDPLPLGACAIYVQEDFLDTDQKATLWIANLYIVIAPTVDDEDAVAFLHTNGDVWVTNTTFQGGGTNCRAVELSGDNGASPRLWLQDVTITGFTRPYAPGILLDNDTTINLNTVVLKDLNLTEGGELDVGSALTAWGGAGVLLEATTITRNFVHGKPAGSKAVALLGGDDGAVIYALPEMTVWNWSDDVEEKTDNVEFINERGGAGSSGGFLQSFVLREIQQEQQSLVADYFGIAEPPAVIPEPADTPAPAPSTTIAPAAVSPTPPADTPAPAAQPGAGGQAGGQQGSAAAPAPSGMLSEEQTEDGLPVAGMEDAAGDGDSGSSAQVGWIVGSAVGAALLVALCGVLVLIVLLRRQRRRQREEQGKESWTMNPHHASWPGSLQSGSTGVSCSGVQPPQGATIPAGSTAISLGGTTRSRTGSASSTTAVPAPVGPGPGLSYIHPTSSATSASMQAARSLSGASVNPTVGSMYPTHSAPSGVSSEGLAVSPHATGVAPDKLMRSATPPQELQLALKPSGGPGAGGPARTPSNGSSTAAGAAGIGQMASLAAQSSAPGAAAREHASSMGIALPTSTRDFSSCGVVHGSQTLGTTFDSIPVDPPALPLPTTADRDGGAVMPPDLLEHALDNMSAAEVAFMGEFRLLGPMERRGGGQGLVQFANQLRTGDPVAIKFFMNSRAFECERELYSQEHLRGMMPAVSLMHSNTDGTVGTEEGWKFPPFIVVERGESLDEWQAHVKPDFATVVQVLSHICERVKTLHDAGVAHRDLKPGNVLWRPKHYSWTLIDFGCAAEIGAVSRLTFSVSYSPPETLMTLRSGQRTIKSDPAADIWAIGLIAYELIHRQRAFREFSWTFTDVLDAAAGSRAYPWEDRPGSFKRDPDLRALGSVVRACLARDMAVRPTAAQLVQKLNRLFDSHGTTLVQGTQSSDVAPSVPMPDAAAMDGTVDVETGGADAEVEAPVWDSRDAVPQRETPPPPRSAVRPPPGITPAMRSHTHTHSRIELNSLQPSSILATTAEVQDDGAFDGLRRALAHAWGGASARLATTLEEPAEATGTTEGAAEATGTTEGAADESDQPPMPAAAALLTTSGLVTTADTGGETSTASAGGGGGNPRSLAECAVSASGAGSSIAAGVSGTHDSG